MICVDSSEKARWRYGDACHLFDDNGDLDALRFFACRLGLKERWFQKDRRLPHYDLSASKRRLAIRLGATEVTRGFVGDVIRRRRGVN